MKYLLKNIFLPIDADFSNTVKILEDLAGDSGVIESAYLLKRSVDARKKPQLKYCISVVATPSDPKKFLKVFKKYSPEEYKEIEYTVPTAKSKTRPVVVGFGPAGMFAALNLARAGLCPIVLERGPDADTRIADVDNLRQNGNLNINSNIQFGEGGAGTFSDGKLTTGIKDPRCRAVLGEFVRFGANENILYEAKAHIGTDVLVGVIKNIRREIIRLGGEVRFNNKLEKIAFSGGKLTETTVSSSEGEYTLPCTDLVLAIGHSARDTFEFLNSAGIPMTSKPFAIGARIEHPQEMINFSQYGAKNLPQLGAADYKLSCHLENGRGVYTFCMCPGGFVVNASSEAGAVVTNGMSYNARNGKNANSALLVGVDERDFGEGALAGMYFQRKIEQAAFSLTNSYKTVSQTVGDFMRGASGNRSNTLQPTVLPETHYDDLAKILPRDVMISMRQGIAKFGKMIKGFDDPDALLTGPETRSSSPVRIIRNDKFQSVCRGIYPCGEGAGYAGGIMSAAVDGLRISEVIIEKYKE